MKTMPVKSTTKSKAAARVQSDTGETLLRSEEMGPEELEAVEACLVDYLAIQTSKERARLMKRLEAPEFKATAHAHINFLGQALPLCTLADDETFASISRLLLLPKYSGDKDLRAMSLWYLAPENSAQVLQELEAYGGDRASGQRRANTIFAELEKLNGSSNDKPLKPSSET